MMEGIDLNQVRQYNTSLKQYRDKAANINAQIRFNSEELQKICAELTKELGVEVNVNNIEQIYAEQLEKIQSTLRSGNAVLAKIADEEKRIALGQQVQAQQNMIQAQQVAQPQQSVTQPQPQVGQPQVQQTVQTQFRGMSNNFLADTGAQGQIPSGPVAGSVFGTPQSAESVDGMSALLSGQKLFNLG